MKQTEPSWIARAPGKVFLLGEYAVLDGAPAVVAAIDRYVEVRMRLRDDAQVRIEARALDAVAEFAADSLPPVDGPLRFALAAWRAVRARFAVLVGQGLDIHVESTLDAGMPAKVGLGGSAAVTVATTAALFAAVGRDLSKSVEREALCATALTAHRAAQDGIGSGADVAASCYGGVVVFEASEGAPVIRRLTLPPGVQLVVGWTGTPASTTGLVQRYLAARNGGAAKRGAFVRESRTCVAMFLAALARHELSADAVDRNGDALEALGEALAIPLQTPTLRTLVATARQLGAAAKLSGAGGGDCGIAITADGDTAARIRASWRDAGILPLDLHVAEEGVSVVRA